MKSKVLLGMSGGIDSTVSAILLKEMGHEVIGITFQMIEQEKNLETSIEQEIVELCQKLKIEHHFLDLRQEFNQKIVNYFVDEYISGRTPFPCAVCNTEIKWKYLNAMALKLNCDFIATGHYVQIEKHKEIFYIKEGVDPDKDQSFFLWNLSQEILAKCIFPLGSFYKDQVKIIAEKFGFNQFKQKKESVGACFISGKDYRLFLNKEMVKRNSYIPEGNFESLDGKPIGKHKGYTNYTVGQRRGLEIENNQANFVVKIDNNKNIVVVGTKSDLYKHEFEVKNYVIPDVSVLKDEIIVKIRYRKQANKARLEILSPEKMKVLLIEPLDSIAPGQTAVFYKDNLVVGGGFID